MNVHLNNRHISQLEELEQLKGKLSLPSQRSRNLSSDRQYTTNFANDFRSTRNSDKQDSQSLEKFLNLKQQNQNVDNLLNSWKQQKQNISLTQSQICQVEKTQVETQIPKYTHLVIEEEENLTTEQDCNTAIQAANNVRVQGKFPVSSKQTTQKKVQQSQPVSNNSTQIKRGSVTTNFQSQTTKSQFQVPQTPQTSKRTVQKNNIKSFQDGSQDIPQTPQQKLQKQSSLLEKTRQGKMNQNINKVLMKKTSDEGERLLISQIAKIKDTVTKLYENRFNQQKIHSSELIEKNFDQILNTIKLDFRCLENDL